MQDYKRKQLTDDQKEEVLLVDAQVLGQLVNKAIIEGHAENEAYFLPMYYTALNAVNRHRQEVADKNA